MFKLEVGKGDESCESEQEHVDGSSGGRVRDTIQFRHPRIAHILRAAPLAPTATTQSGLKDDVNTNRNPSTALNNFSINIMFLNDIE